MNQTSFLVMRYPTVSVHNIALKRDARNTGFGFCWRLRGRPLALRYAPVLIAGIRPQHGERQLRPALPAFGLLPSCVPPCSLAGIQSRMRPASCHANRLRAFLPRCDGISFPLSFQLLRITQRSKRTGQTAGPPFS